MLKHLLLCSECVRCPPDRATSTPGCPQGLRAPVGTPEGLHRGVQNAKVLAGAFLGKQK